MKSEIKEISPTQREIHIEIDPESLKQAYGLVSQKYAKKVSVPGFRKGFAPLDVVRLRYRDEIRSEVLQQVVPLKVSEAIQKHELRPLVEPQLHIENIDDLKVNGSETVKVHAHVEVMPEVVIPDYKGVEVTRRIKPVDDSEIDDLIKHKLEQEAALIPVEDRPSELGDSVVADLEGVFDDEPEGEPIRADDLEVKLGDEVIEKAFTENLVGVMQDDEKEFSVTYPAEFSSSALAGRTVHYKAKIKSVGRMETPEANDEWAKSLDEDVASVEDLRRKLRRDLETYAMADADARVRNEALAKLIEQNAFEVPNALVENQARNLLNNFARDLQQRGVDLNAVESGFVQMAYQQMRTQAERDVRGALLLEKIGDAENINVDKVEVDDEISKMAEYYRTSPEEVRESMIKQGGERTIENNLRTRKTIEALVSYAKITDGPWTDETPSDEHPEEEKTKKSKKKATAKKAKNN
jgi:trigger factor